VSGLAEGSAPFPSRLELVYTKAIELQDQAALYYMPMPGEGGPEPPFARLHGPPPSYEDILNLEVALQAASAFARPTVALVKHGRLYGLASAESIGEAFTLAYRADERAAEWSLAGLNRAVTEESARLLAKEPIAALLAPGYEAEALELLRKRKGFKVFQAGQPQGQREELELRGTIFGLLVRVRERGSEPELAEPKLEVVSKREPTLKERTDLCFAWKALAWAGPEAALIAKDECLVGLGVGQASLIEAVALAIRKAGPRAKGAALALPALPDRDPLDLAAAARITGIITSSSLANSQELIRAADEHGLALALSPGS
jgi:phosphoribosylaminoimidazolecarboxamide formyltransferase/IMP cyclohydrolase